VEKIQEQTKKKRVHGWVKRKGEEGFVGVEVFLTILSQSAGNKEIS